MRLPELLQFRAPSGTADAIYNIAEQEGLSLSEYLRRAILADVEERTRDDDGPDAAGDAEQRTA